MLCVFLHCFLSYGFCLFCIVLFICCLFLRLSLPEPGAHTFDQAKLGSRDPSSAHLCLSSARITERYLSTLAFWTQALMFSTADTLQSESHPQPTNYINHLSLNTYTKRETDTHTQRGGGRYKHREMYIQRNTHINTDRQTHTNGRSFRLRKVEIMQNTEIKPCVCPGLRSFSQSLYGQPSSQDAD